MVAVRLQPTGTCARTSLSRVATIEWLRRKIDEGEASDAAQFMLPLRDANQCRAHLPWAKSRTATIISSLRDGRLGPMCLRPRVMPYN